MAMGKWPDILLDRCAGLPNAAISEGAFGDGAAVWVGKREVAHFDDESTLDVRLTKPLIRAYRSESARTSGSACGRAVPTGSKSASPTKPT